MDLFVWQNKTPHTSEVTYWKHWVCTNCQIGQAHTAILHSGVVLAAWRAQPALRQHSKFCSHPSPTGFLAELHSLRKDALHTPHTHLSLKSETLRHTWRAQTNIGQRPLRGTVANFTLAEENDAKIASEFQTNPKTGFQQTNKPMPKTTKYIYIKRGALINSLY